MASMSEKGRAAAPSFDEVVDDQSLRNDIREREPRVPADFGGRERSVVVNG